MADAIAAGEILPHVIAVYEGSDGDATKALYAQLEQLGAIGLVALNLFRAQKNSARAKVYRGGNGRGRYRDQAYDRKQWAIGNLAQALTAHAETLGLRWGWGKDTAQARHDVVLYVDLPTGQVSFHGDQRGDGPDYPAAWDGVPGQSPDRILRFTARVIAAQAADA